MPEQRSESNESRWQLLVELRQRREIVARWLQTDDVPAPLREQLRLQLLDIEGQLTRLEGPRRVTSVPHLRKAV